MTQQMCLRLRLRQRQRQRQQQKNWKSIILPWTDYHRGYLT
jgi:hypothetical protein